MTSRETLVPGVTRPGLLGDDGGGVGVRAWAGGGYAVLPAAGALVMETLQPGGGDEVTGLGEGEAGEIGHGVGGLGRRGGVEQADAGRGDTLGAGGWGLGEDGLGRGGIGGEFGGGSDFEAAAADIDFGGARAQSDEGGNVDELGAEAIGGLDAPAAPDMGSGIGLLAGDASGGNGGGVEVIAGFELQAALGGQTLGIGGSHAAEVGHGDLAAMDGEAHADQARGERDDDEHENLGEQTKEADHPATKGSG